MIKRNSRAALSFFFLMVFLCLSTLLAKVSSKNTNSWKAGLAKVVITPEEPIWLAGYANRNKPSEGKIQDLYAKALALEDPVGHRMVLVTSDLIGFSRSVAEAIANGAKQRSGLSRDRLLLTSSHTHTGPVIRESLLDMYDLSPQQVTAVTNYTRQLEQRIIALVETAIHHLAPAKLSFARGEVGFAVNRRVSSPTGYKIAVNPEGPVDHSVPVLRVEGIDGQLRAVVLGYACHNTTLTGEFYQFSGDYAGYAQSYLEQKYPQATALFVMGCGADANPNPRSKLELAEQHGRSLGDAVSKVLSQPMKPITGRAKTQFERVQIPLASLPSREELQKRLNEDNVFRQRHARHMLRILDEQGKLPNQYPYPIQAWQFGQDLTLVALAGEVVVDYALRLNKEIGAESLWTVAYANDVFAYIPSVRILQEGGYEADQSGIYYGMPTRFAPEVEEIIVKKVKEIVRKVRGK